MHNDFTTLGLLAVCTPATPARSPIVAGVQELGLARFEPTTEPFLSLRTDCAGKATDCAIGLLERSVQRVKDNLQSQKSQVMRQTTPHQKPYKVRSSTERGNNGESVPNVRSVCPEYP